MSTIAKIVGLGLSAWILYSQHQVYKMAEEQGRELASPCMPLTMARTLEQRQRLIEHNNKYPECKQFKRCNP